MDLAYVDRVLLRIQPLVSDNSGRDSLQLKLKFLDFSRVPLEETQTRLRVETGSTILQLQITITSCWDKKRILPPPASPLRWIMGAETRLNKVHIRQVLPFRSEEDRFISPNPTCWPNSASACRNLYGLAERKRLAEAVERRGWPTGIPPACFGHLSNDLNR